MIKIKYNAINWPVTLQNYISEYSDEIYKQLFYDYTFRFNLNQEYNYEYNKDDSFILNNTSFVIYNKQTKQIIKYAFINLPDFIWNLNMINIDSIVFELESNVYESIKSDLRIYIENELLELI